MTPTEREAVAEAIATLEEATEIASISEVATFEGEAEKLSDKIASALASLRAVAPAPADQSDVPLWAHWSSASAMTDSSIDKQFKIIETRRAELAAELKFRGRPPADQSDAGRDGVPSSRQEIALHFCTHTWTASERSIDPTIACEPCCKKADTIIRALASAPSETVGRGEVAMLRELVVRLSGALTDEGSDWSAEGLENLRTDVASTLPSNMRPDWLAPFAVIHRPSVALALSTADRDAIRDEMKSVQYYATEMSERAEAETWVRNRANLIVKHLTAALGLLGEG